MLKVGSQNFGINQWQKGFDLQLYEQSFYLQASNQYRKMQLQATKYSNTHQNDSTGDMVCVTLQDSHGPLNQYHVKKIIEIQDLMNILDGNQESSNKTDKDEGRYLVVPVLRKTFIKIQRPNPVREVQLCNSDKIIRKTLYSLIQGMESIIPQNKQDGVPEVDHNLNQTLLSDILKQFYKKHGKQYKNFSALSHHDQLSLQKSIQNLNLSQHSIFYFVSFDQTQEQQEHQRKLQSSLSILEPEIGSLNFKKKQYSFVNSSQISIQPEKKDHQIYLNNYPIGSLLENRNQNQNATRIITPPKISGVDFGLDEDEDMSDDDSEEGEHANWLKMSINLGKAEIKPNSTSIPSLSHQNQFQIDEQFDDF